MDVQAAFDSLKRGWHYVVLAALGAAVAGYLLAWAQPPTYETTASYIVSPTRSNPDAAAEAVRTLDDARSRAILTTFAEVLGSATTTAEAAASVGLGEDLLEKYAFRTVVVPEANIADLTVTGPDASMTVALAGAIGETGAQRFVDLYEIYDIGLLDPAAAPTAPSNRGSIETSIVAAALGILVGAVVALAVNAPRIRKGREMRRRIATYGEAGATVTPLNEDGQRYLRVTAG
ncbi:MAG TPA: hypothetical protein VLD62_09425 [Acidimicrobiia bacterium]|nr:hypothetical protein [Acidimicrobiia bacterium]